jgi:hypothetical protein
MHAATLKTDVEPKITAVLASKAELVSKKPQYLDATGMREVMAALELRVLRVQRL